MKKFLILGLFLFMLVFLAGCTGLNKKVSEALSANNSPQQSAKAASEQTDEETALVEHKETTLQSDTPDTSPSTVPSDESDASADAGGGNKNTSALKTELKKLDNNLNEIKKLFDDADYSGLD